MMTRKEISEMTNAELNIKLKKIEDEYEAEKKNASEVILRMEALNKEYVTVKSEIEKRNSSIWQ